MKHLETIAVIGFITSIHGCGRGTSNEKIPVKVVRITTLQAVPATIQAKELRAKGPATEARKSHGHAEVVKGTKRRL